MAKPSAEKRAQKRARAKARKEELRKKAEEIAKRNVEVESSLASLQMQARELVPVEEKKKGDKSKEEDAPEEPEVDLSILDDETGPGLEEFKRIFTAFATIKKTRAEELEEEEEKERALAKENAKQIAANKAANEDEEDEKPLSRRAARLKNRLSIAELKQLVDKPEAVDIHDCNSTDPKLLVILKSYRNTVTVPTHWLDRRKYLQNKRGIEKPPFELPHFIAATGIGEIRQTQVEKADAKSAKQNARERMRPKQGKMDIDYAVLRDAFFVHQTKPSMTLHNDLYYEGKEYEAQLKKKRPGNLSEELMRALGMTEGHKSPTPWLFNMQRFGPPPSYPSLRIPGVNWPIPEGCSYGTMEGQWGKPPVDEYGRPLYGDVFGTEHKKEESGPLEVELWGTIQAEELRDGMSSDDEEMEDEDEDQEEDMDEEAQQSGTESQVSGFSTPSGLVTPDGSIDIRRSGSETPEQRSFYKVIEQKKTSLGAGYFPSDHTYELPSAKDAELERKRAALRGQVNLALNPEDLENLDASQLQARYEAQLKADTSSQVVERAERDEVFEEEARKKKRKLASSGGGQKNKKYKDFKF